MPSERVTRLSARQRGINDVLTPPESRSARRHRINDVPTPYGPLETDSAMSEDKERPKIAGGVTGHRLREQIRHLERLLALKTLLPADVQREKEQELSDLREQLALELKRRERKKERSNSNFARMVQGKAALRTTKRLKLALETAQHQGERATLEAQIIAANIDHAYTVNFPLEDRYVGLNNRDGTGDQIKSAAPELARVSMTMDVDENHPPDTSFEELRDIRLAQIRQAKPPLWPLIENALADGSLSTVQDGTHEGLYELGLGTKALMERNMADLLTEQLDHLTNDNGFGYDSLRQIDIDTAMDTDDKPPPGVGLKTRKDCDKRRVPRSVRARRPERKELPLQCLHDREPHLSPNPHSAGSESEEKTTVDGTTAKAGAWEPEIFQGCS